MKKHQTKKTIFRYRSNAERRAEAEIDAFLRRHQTGGAIDLLAELKQL
ncbi:hypothetical protein JNJ66_01380 [Candidatus Saccharibacteria bacterium]|nr:hypothetical protein [Candidatus Saccharibacteria bacterium]